MSEEEKEKIYSPGSREGKQTSDKAKGTYNKYPRQYEQEVGLIDALSQGRVSEAAEEAEFPQPTKGEHIEAGTRSDHFETGRGIVKEDPIP